MSESNSFNDASNVSNVTNDTNDIKINESGKIVPPEGMTKSAYKKMLRKQRHEETKAQYRLHRKELKKNRDLQRREEIEKLRSEGKEFNHLIKPRNKNKLNKTYQKEKDGEIFQINPINDNSKIKIIIDCAYDDYMTEKEVISLSSQITRAYSTNRQAVKNYYSKEIEKGMNGNNEPAPTFDIAPTCKLFISGLDKRLKERFDKVLPDYAKWDPECAKLTESNLETVLNEDCKVNEELDNVVYLSADVDEKIEELKAGETYIIGGIVDKGRHKNLCKGTAEKLSQDKGKKIRILRLPIDEYIKLSGRKVLTTAHVVELLLKWCLYRDWKKAFEEVLPPRKLKDGENGDDDNDDDDE